MRKTIRSFMVFVLGLFLGACSLVETPTPDNSSSTVHEEHSSQEETTVDSSDSEDQTTDKTVIVPEEATTDGSEESQKNSDLDEFPPQIEETIEIEGMQETIVLNLYNPVDAPFITYVPTDMAVEEASSGEGESYRFYANYEGNKIEDINLHVYLFAEHITEEPKLEEDGTLAMLLDGMSPVPSEQEWYDWSITEYQSSEGSRHAMLGEHNNHYFVMVINSSVMYSEGFVPRVNKVIKHFYWKDTQDYLVQ